MAAIRERVGLFLLGALAFSSAIGNRPEALDDRRIILDQPVLRTGGPLAILSPLPLREEWLPVRDLTYRLAFALHGEETERLARGLVLGNLLLHAALAVAVHALALRVLASRRAAFAAAALFAVHPLHAESVAWLSGRKDSLSGLFVVACVVVWLDALRARRAEDGRAQALVLGLTLLALLSKASAIALALLLPLADLLLGPPRPLLRRALSWAPAGLLCAGFAVGYSRLVAAWGAAHGQQVIKVFPGDPPWTVLFTNAAVVPQYLRGALLPEGRLFSAQHYRTGLDGEVALGLVVTALALGGALLLARRSRPLGFAALWFLAALVPFLNLTPHGIPYAERYAHLASVGACLLLGAALTALRGRRAQALLLAALVLAGALRCLQLGRVFESGRTLWTHALRVEPTNAIAATNLASWWEDQRDWARAEEGFRAALALEPTRPNAHQGLARVLERQGRLEEALEHWLVAHRARPGDVRPVYGAAGALYKLGRKQEALALYEKIAQVWPAASELAMHNRVVIVRELHGEAAAARALEEYRARWGG